MCFFFPIHSGLGSHIRFQHASSSFSSRSKLPTIPEENTLSVLNPHAAVFTPKSHRSSLVSQQDPTSHSIHLPISLPNKESLFLDNTPSPPLPLFSPTHPVKEAKHWKNESLSREKKPLSPPVLSQLFFPFSSSSPSYDSSSHSSEAFWEQEEKRKKKRKRRRKKHKKKHSNTSIAPISPLPLATPSPDLLEKTPSPDLTPFPSSPSCAPTLETYLLQKGASFSCFEQVKHPYQKKKETTPPVLSYQKKSFKETSSKGFKKKYKQTSRSLTTISSPQKSTSSQQKKNTPKRKKKNQPNKSTRASFYQKKCVHANSKAPQKKKHSLISPSSYRKKSTKQRAFSPKQSPSFQKKNKKSSGPKNTPKSPIRRLVLRDQSSFHTLLNTLHPHAEDFVTLNDLYQKATGQVGHPIHDLIDFKQIIDEVKSFRYIDDKIDHFKLVDLSLLDVRSCSYLIAKIPKEGYRKRKDLFIYLFMMCYQVISLWEFADPPTQKDPTLIYQEGRWLGQIAYWVLFLIQRYPDMLWPVSLALYIQSLMNSQKILWKYHNKRTGWHNITIDLEEILVSASPLNVILSFKRKDHSLFSSSPQSIELHSCDNNFYFYHSEEKRAYQEEHLFFPEFHRTGMHPYFSIFYLFKQQETWESNQEEYIRHLCPVSLIGRIIRKHGLLKSPLFLGY